MATRARTLHKSACLFCDLKRQLAAFLREMGPFVNQFPSLRAETDLSIWVPILGSLTLGNSFRGCWCLHASSHKTLIADSCKTTAGKCVNYARLVPEVLFRLLPPEAVAILALFRRTTVASWLSFNIGCGRLLSWMLYASNVVEQKTYLQQFESNNGNV